MANQPTKYRKFLAGAATASLVATAVVPSALAANFSDVSENNSHKEHIDALAAAGIISGYEDGSFGPNNSLTRSHVVKMMGKWLVSLGHEVPADYKTVQRFEDISLTTKDEELLKFSALVKDKGVFVGNEGKLDPSSNITRENMAVVLVRAFDAVNGTDLVNYVKEQTFDRDVTDLDSAKAEARSAIDVLDFFDITNPAAPVFNPKGTVTRGQFASFLNKTIKTENPTPVVTTATKVESVSATNLKEVVVTFDGTVDAATAEDDSNYSIAGKAIEAATLSEDGKSVKLTLDTTAGVAAALTNQTEYKLTFSNVKAGDKIISVKDYKFTPVDSALPTVTNVEALGNKTIKFTFSEPVQNPTTASFLVDGKVALGYATTVNNIVTLRLYAPLTNGEHTVQVKNVQDFFGLKSLSQDQKFNVVEDVTAPAIASVVKASFESVTLKFSEPVDPTTVNGSNVYWLQGSTKKTAAANVTALSDDTFVFDFSGNPLQYTTDVYVTGVKDYSGNSIADNAKVSVTPVVDTVRPEVVNVELDSTSQFTVKFSKKVDATAAKKASNYVIKNAKGTEVSKLKNISLSADGKTATVSLVAPLDEGEKYTLEIAGISDTTTLKNVMLPYSKELTTEDETNPSVEGVFHNAATNSLSVNFDEVMALSGDGSVVDSAKYMYQVNGVWKNLPSSVLLNVTPDGKAVLITFPSSVDVTTISHLRVQLVKDTEGNYLDGLTQDVEVDPAAAPKVTSVQAVSPTKINVNFDGPIQGNTINAADFTVKEEGGTTRLNVVSAAPHPTVSSRVVLTLADTTALTEDGKYNKGTAASPNVVATEVVIRANATTSNSDGKAIENGATNSENVVDKIRSTVKEIKGSADGMSITVVFNEDLKAESTGTVLTNYATDLVITNEDGAVMIPGGTGSKGYSVAATTGDNELVINFTAAHSGVIDVAIENPRFIIDKGDNVISPLEATDAAPDTTGATITSTATYTSDVITVTASENLQAVTAGSLKVEGSVLGTFADSVTLVAGTDYTAALDASNNKLIKVTLTAAGKAKLSPVATTKFKVTALPAVKDLAGNSVDPTANAATVDVATY